MECGLIVLAELNEYTKVSKNPLDKTEHEVTVVVLDDLSHKRETD